MWCPCHADPCPNCGEDPRGAIFALVIDHEVIASVHQAPAGHVYPDHPTWTLLTGAAEPESVPDDGVSNGLSGGADQTRAAPHSGDFLLCSPPAPNGTLRPRG